MSRPPCTVVIPTWNARDLVERCLRSVHRAIDPERDEIVVVDDGSTDGTLESIARNFPHVAILRFERNQGFGAACNAGVAQAHHNIVVLLNNDILLEPDFLPPLLEHFMDPLVFAVNPQVFQKDGSTPGGGLVRGYFHCGLLRLRWSLSSDEREHACLTLYANGAATAIRRDRYQTLNGFDPLFYPFYSEDLDLSYRAYQHGWVVRYEPRSVVLHDHSVTISAAFGADFVARISKRNRILFVWRNIRDAEILTRHVIWMLLRATGAILTMDRIFLNAFREALRRLPEVRRLRRQDPPPVVRDREILAKTSHWS